MHLQVCLEHQVKFGEHVGIIGSTKELGSWEEQVELEWTTNGWVCQLKLPGETLVEFKFVIFLVGGKDKIWEDGNNRVVELPKDGKFDIVCHWNRTEEPLELLGTPKFELVGEAEKNTGEDASASVTFAPEKVQDISVVENGDPAPEAESSKFGGQWQGSKTVFMRSNEHLNKEADRMWDTTGLDGIALKLVEGDKASRNWWRKVSCFIVNSFSNGSYIPCTLSVPKYKEFWLDGTHPMSIFLVSHPTKTSYILGRRE